MMSSPNRKDRPSQVPAAPGSPQAVPAVSNDAYQSDRRSLFIGIAVVVLMVAAGVIYASLTEESEPAGADEPEGVQRFEYEGGNQVDGPVEYAEVPPVGGPHANVWQNCGFYDGPVVSERAVYSLEHGAVWITYRPDLDEQQKAKLAEIAQRNDDVLVSAYEGLPAPVVASAWNHQLVLESVDDPRLNEFVVALQNSEEAPEPDAPCTGGSSEMATPSS